MAHGGVLLGSPFSKELAVQLQGGQSADSLQLQHLGLTLGFKLRPRSYWAASSLSLRLEGLLKPGHFCPMRDSLWAIFNLELPIGLTKTLSDLLHSLRQCLPNSASSHFYFYKLTSNKPLALLILSQGLLPGEPKRRRLHTLFILINKY